MRNIEAPSATYRAQEKLISAALAANVAVFPFSNMGELSQIVQLGAVGALIAAAAAALTIPPRYRTMVTLLELACIPVAGASMINGALLGNTDTTYYSVLFGVALLALAVITRRVSLEPIATGLAIGFGIAVIIVLLGAQREYFDALSASVENRWMRRFSPLGLHPNLVGFCFGGGVIINIYAGTYAGRTMRTVHWITAAICASFVLAASSRGGLLALVTSAGLIGLLGLRGRSARMLSLGMAIALLSAVAILIAWSKSRDYLSNLLELQSQTRGVLSGGSGRTEIWRYSWYYMTSDSRRLLFGDGLRSTPFATESSYLTIWLESGLVVGTAFLLSIVATWGRTLRALRLGGRASELCVAWLCTYCLIESFFNRYLVAIGNPTSIAFLLLMFAAGMPRLLRVQQVEVASASPDLLPATSSGLPFDKPEQPPVRLRSPFE